MDSDTITIQDDVVAIELPAPEGWKKKFTPKKGGTPRRNEIVFISPTDEEIRSKRQLDQYLKSHPGGPSASEFDWGTGDTPRRSTRLSEKSKAVETSESETPEKKQKTSSSKKEAKGKKDDFDGEGESTKDKEAAAEETKEVALEDAEDVGDHDRGEVVTEDALADKDNMKDAKQKTSEEEVVTEETLAVIDNVDNIELKAEKSIDEVNMEKPENEDTGNKASDAKEEDAENKLLPVPGLEEKYKEAEKEPMKPEDSSQLPMSSEAVPEAQDGKAGQEDNHSKETTTEKAAKAEEAAAKPDNENQEVGKPTESHSVSCEEAPHEPKASQVSC